MYEANSIAADLIKCYAIFRHRGRWIQHRLTLILPPRGPHHAFEMRSIEKTSTNLRQISKIFFALVETSGRMLATQNTASRRSSDVRSSGGPSPHLSSCSASVSGADRALHAEIPVSRNARSRFLGRPGVAEYLGECGRIRHGDDRGSAHRSVCEMMRSVNEV